MASVPQRIIARLLGVSAHELARLNTPQAMSASQVDSIRRARGGNLTPLPVTETEWFHDDLDQAERLANMGKIKRAAQLMQSARRDGVLAGVLSTRTGLTTLPKRFRGPSEVIADLELGHESYRSTFDEMCPPATLAALAEDEILLGVCVGELVEVEGRSFPLLKRLDPQFLEYRWDQGQWFYESVAGLLPITPGDGRWVLGLADRSTPWNRGLWKAVGYNYISKVHANLYLSNYCAKLANPARVATFTGGSSNEQNQDFLEQLIAWGVNTVFALPTGYDVKLLESNGTGWESFLKTIEMANAELIIAVAGQSVTTTGGTGFANAGIHEAIRADLIKTTADSLAYTINTQVLSAFVLSRFGESYLETLPCIEWDVTPPVDREQEAKALVAVAQVISTMTAALKEHDMPLDVATLCQRFGVPIAGDVNGDGKPDEKPALKVIRGGA